MQLAGGVLQLDDLALLPGVGAGGDRGRRESSVADLGLAHVMHQAGCVYVVQVVYVGLILFRT